MRKNFGWFEHYFAYTLDILNIQHPIMRKIVMEKVKLIIDY